MSLFRKRAWQGMTPQEHIRHDRSLRASGTGYVSADTAMRHSAVWACLRLRANLISTMPVDVFRTVLGLQVEVPKPPVLVKPGGERVGIHEWLYSSQVDLDRGGNCFGLITERDGAGLPRRIDLQPLQECSVIVEKGQLAGYRIAGTRYPVEDVWHERQWTVAGLPVGLSPVAYAAWSIGEYLSIQEFANEWFGNGATPKGHLKNTGKTLTADQSDAIKVRFKQAMKAGDVFVSGADWEYNMMQVEQAATNWIEAKKFSVEDIARFFDCPGDLIDAAVSTGHITYASITQRNLQFLIMHLGPAVFRREVALSDLLSKPRFVKLNSNALLRMDPKTQAEVFKMEIDSRTLAPSEIRELKDRKPFTEAQLAEFDRFWPAKQPATAANGSQEETIDV